MFATRVPAAADSTCFRQIAYPNGLTVHVSDGSTELRDMIGVRSVLPPEDVKAILSHVQQPDFAWTTNRHVHHPTTDVETSAVPWLDSMLQPHLRDMLLPMIADLFQVTASHLVLRDTFIVKYEAEAVSKMTTCGIAAAANAMASPQTSLGSHWDESCFSFVVQLNSLDEFTGGGTKFAHASEALSAAPGEALCFCGYNLHEGAAVQAGVRYILTGFVDLRAPPSVMARFTTGQPVTEHGRGPRHRLFTNFASPHLPFNVVMLSDAYEASGEELLRAIAYSPPSISHLDMGPLAKQCDRWLTKGECDDEKFYRFLCLVVGE